MSAADMERIEAIAEIDARVKGVYRHSLDSDDAKGCFHCIYRMHDDLRYLLSQLSALSEALSAAHKEIARLKATTT